MRQGSGGGDRSPSLRVAYLADQYPLLTFTAVWREIEALRAKGVGVEPFSVWRPQAAETLAGDEPSRTSYLAECRPAAALGAHARLLAANPARYLRTLRRALGDGHPGLRGLPDKLARFTWAAVLVRWMRARGLTHLHNHGTDTSCTVAMLAATLGGIPFSFTLHGPRIFFSVEPRQLVEKLRRALFVRCISQFTRSQCALWLSPDDWYRLQVIHCGVAPRAYSTRVHQGRGSHVLFVGRPGIRKGLPFLVEAVAALHAEHPDVRLTIVGDGPARAAMEARARAAGLVDVVRFTGYQSSGQVADWLSRADVVVLPSLAEGVPVVLMEAMAAGVPVVATNVGGTSELVADGVNGFLVPPGVPDALVHRIRQLLDDADLRTRLGRAGQDTVAGAFDIDRETAQLQRLFEAAIGTPARQPSPGHAGSRDRPLWAPSTDGGSARAAGAEAHWQEHRGARRRT